MNKQQITQAIDTFVKGQGNQAGLQGLEEILHALNNDSDRVMLDDIPYVTSLSGLSTTELTAEQAEEAGFPMSVIEALKTKAHPTIRFSDMVITFNAYEEISDELSIWTTVVYDAPSDMVYHCALYLYMDGRILYNVDIMQH